MNYELFRNFAPQFGKKMKKILFILIAFQLTVVTSTAQIRWNERYQQYINQYKDIAIEEMHRWKILPASLLPRDSSRVGQEAANWPEGAITTSASSAMAGRGAPPIMTMTSAMSASVPTTRLMSRSRTTVASLQIASATRACSV